MVAAAYFVGLPSRRYNQKKRKSVRLSRKVTAAATAVVAAPPEEVKEYVLSYNFFIDVRLYSEESFFVSEMYRGSFMCFYVVENTCF